MLNIVKYEDLLLANEEINRLTNNKNIKKIYFNDKLDVKSILLQVDIFNRVDTYFIYDCLFLSLSDVFKNNLELLETMVKLKDELDIYLFCDGKLLSNKEFKKIIDNFKIINIDPIDRKNKQSIVNNLLASKNISLSKNIYSHLINSVSTDYGVIKNEVNKIFNLIESKTNDEELMLLISNYNEENVFYLVENILLNKQNYVWKIYNDLVYRKVDEIALINALCMQLYNLYYICALNMKNKSINDIATNVQVPTFAVISFKNKFNNNLEANKIKKMILDLYDLEFKIKTSKVIKKIALKKLIINWLNDN